MKRLAKLAVDPVARIRSLRRRLLHFIVWPLLVILVGSAVLDYQSALQIAAEAYDNGLTQTAISLVTRLERDDDDKDIEVDIPPAADQILRADTEDQVLYLVVDNHGKVVAGDAQLLALPRPLHANQTELNDTQLGTLRLRAASYHYLSSGMDATVIVAETTFKRARAARQILMAMLWPNLLLTLVAVVLVYFGVRFALRPLDARDKTDFSPVDEGPVADEVRPLVVAINRLMGNLRDASQVQQAFLSNAAHQLRTPVAGLQTQLELALETLPAEARPRIARLRDSARRLSHFIHQMLALARSSSDGVLSHDQHPVDLPALLENSVSELWERATARGLDLGCEAAPARVAGSAWMLREMLDNLLENAVAYTPAGGRVTARCGVQSDGQVFIEVEDNGPGIPPAERARVFERFYRGFAGQLRPEGSGLGLSIVHEVVRQHGGRLGLEAGEGGCGCRFRINFPVMRGESSGN